MTTYKSSLGSPIGPLLLLGDGSALTGLFMEETRHPPTVEPPTRADDAPFASARQQLEAYFAGERREFEIAMAATGTPFQRQVWAALLEIPFGATESYGELATRLGKPNASRAVGAANARNPISIIVPCHRVIGKSGALIGYGGGMARKRWLLTHEQREDGRRLTGHSSRLRRAGVTP